MQRIARLAPLLCRCQSAATAPRAFAAVAEAKPQATYEVPAGHASSDLSAIACNISLNRRRDLTLRQDLTVFLDGEQRTLADVMRGKLMALFGVPDMGSVCTKEHFPNFVKHAEELKKQGVSVIACAAVTSPEQLASWAEKAGNVGNTISLIADQNGSMTRMLGLDLPKSSEGGPTTQRYAALVDDGILLKLKVEDDLGKVDKSGAQSLLDVMKVMRCDGK